MTKFYLFRHGETSYSKNHLPYPADSFSVKILPESVPVIEKLADYLETIHFDKCFSSEYLRCSQTARIISDQTKMEFVFDAKLNEYENETFEELKIRVAKFLDEISQSDFQNVAVCTHGAVVAGIRSLLSNKTFEEVNLKNYPPTGVLVIKENLDEKQINFNDGIASIYREQSDQEDTN